MSYIIAGRAIKSEYLAIGTLLSTVGLFVAVRGGGDKKAASSSTQPVASTSTSSYGASSKDEEEFIRNFITEAEKTDQGGKH